VQVLDLSNCTILVSLCSSISALTQLTDLDLSGPNMLFKHGPLTHSIRNPRPAVEGAALPDDAAGTAYTLSLHLHEGRTHALPEQQQLGVLRELASLSSLRRLRLAHNRDMRVLPRSVCKLTQLQHLDASSCSLRFLNDELWQCVGLRELLLGDNVLASLSDDIRGLTNLEVREALAVALMPSRLITQGRGPV
jgi:hypothetical protein